MRILVIRPGALGDALLTFPVLDALRARYIGAEIVFVSNKAVLPLALATGVADTVFDYGDALMSALFGKIQVGTVLHTLLQGTDLAICWLNDAEGIVKANLSGIERVMIAPGRPRERMHIVDYQGSCAGLKITQIPCYRDRLMTSKKMRPCIVVHPGSGGVRKCWPVERFAEVIHALWERYVSVLVLGGPADHERIGRLLQQLSRPPSGEQLSVLVDAPLLDIARRLCACAGYVGNDSGITHLAALVGAPTLALFGPSDPCVWHPVGRDVCIVHEPDLGNLAVDVVLQKLESLSSLEAL